MDRDKVDNKNKKGDQVAAIQPSCNFFAISHGHKQQLLRPTAADWLLFQVFDRKEKPLPEALFIVHS